MTTTRRSILQATAGLAGLTALPQMTFAQTRVEATRVEATRAETLRYVTGANVNTMDLTVYGSTRESFGLSMVVYDRLVRLDRKKIGDNWVFDPSKIIGELAQGYTISPDGKKITIKLRPDATFQDGSKVTVEDVKWSLDRCVSAKSLAPPQFFLGSMTKPEQYTIVDDHTIEVTLPDPDRLGLANLCVPYAQIFNTKLVKPHCTPDDPWGLEWTKQNTASSGAYIVESWKPGESVILRRHDGWKGGIDGALPYFKRIIIQTVPEPATRANLVEKGDADLCIDLAASDIPTMEKAGKAKIVSTPQTNGFTHISMNCQMAPFDNVKVRQAIAAALPYEDMFKAALFARGRRLYGADWTTPPDGVFPQPMPFKQDLAKATQLLTEAGFPKGFKTTFAFSTGAAATAEPMAALLKESLGKIGIDVEIQKKPDAEFNTAESEKKLPFFTDAATAWLPATDYFFRLYFTRDQRWNFASWINKDMETISQSARFELDPAKYEADSKEMIELYLKNVPLITLWQPNHDAAMAKNIDGYTYEFYRQADFRDLKRV
jgi:peptide/nickel transport system substrate-binding protein